jgi:hypothetical protein
MSKKYPECPLYNHDNCRDYYNPKLCAVVRDDNICIKKAAKKMKKMECAKSEESTVVHNSPTV